MAVVKLYRPHSDSYRLVLEPDGKKLRDIIGDSLKDNMIFINGHYTEDLSYKIKSDDLVIIKSIPVEV